ncbi:hypothetical protein CVT26_011579, partial [Gymnopilus dilepis]
GLQGTHTLTGVAAVGRRAAFRGARNRYFVDQSGFVDCGGYRPPRILFDRAGPELKKGLRVAAHVYDMLMIHKGAFPLAFPSFALDDLSSPHQQSFVKSSEAFTSTPHYTFCDFFIAQMSGLTSALHELIDGLSDIQITRYSHRTPAQQNLWRSLTHDLHLNLQWPQQPSLSLNIVRPIAHGFVKKHLHYSLPLVVITFSDEVDLVWVKNFAMSGSAWSLGKILFLLVSFISQLLVAALICWPHTSESVLYIGRRSQLLKQTMSVSVLFRITYGFGASDFLTFFICAYILGQFHRFDLTVYGDLTSFLSGVHLFRWQAWTGLVGCMLAEGILQIRIYALYSLNKWILVLLIACFVGSTATSAWIAATFLQAQSFRAKIAVSHYGTFLALAVTIPGGKFCVPFGISPHFYTYWIPMLAFETLLCVLAVFRGFQAFRSNGSLFQRGRQLVGILVRDSLMYFFVICVTYLTCLLFWTMAPTTLLEVPVGFTVAMSCVVASRVVLNVRQVSRDVDSNLPTSQIPTSRAGYGTSFCSPGNLTDFEMDQLRSMRAERHWSEIVPEYYEDSPPFVVL